MYTETHNLQVTGTCFFLCAAAILTWIVVASTFGSIALGWAVYSVIRKAVRGKCCDDKDDELNSLGPSIVVYPSYHGKAPQLL